MRGRSCADRPQLAAGACAFAIFAVAAWQVSPSVPGGDEPHYLVITQSLLLDGDLKIENNHRRGDYQAYYAGALRAALHPPRRATGRSTRSTRRACRRSSRRHLRSAATAAVVFLLLVIASCGSALAWHLGVAGDRTGRRGVVRLGRGHACGDDHLSQLHGVSRRSWRRDRADRRLGAVAGGRGAADGRRAACCRGSSTAPRSRSCRGCTADSRCSRAASARWCCCACRRRGTRRGRRWRFCRCRRSARSLWIGFFVAIYGIADPSAPYGTVREFSLGFIPGGLAGLLFDQRFGLLRQCPGAHRRPRGSGDDAALADAAGRGGLERPGRSPPGARTAVRDGSVPADCDELRHVVGRLERPGAVREPGGADSGDSLRRRLESHARTAVRARSRPGLLAFTAFCRACSSSPTAAGSPTTRARRPRCGSTGRRRWRRWLTALPVWFRGQEGAFAHRHRRLGGGDRAGLVVRARARGQRRASRIAAVCSRRLLPFTSLAAMVAVTVVWRLHGAGRLCRARRARRSPRPGDGAASARRPGHAAAGACGWTAARDVAARAGGAPCRRRARAQRSDGRRPAGDSGWPLSGARSRAAGQAAC